MMEIVAIRVIPYDGDRYNTVLAYSLEYRTMELFVIPYEEHCSGYNIRNIVLLVAFEISHDNTEIYLIDFCGVDEAKMK